MDELAASLWAAQQRAEGLFRAVLERKLIRAGETEASVSEAIFELGKQEFGAAKHWHRRVVRAGPHTCLPYAALPDDRAIAEDDIVSVDLGPVFGEHEADYGRTYVLGDDPHKHRLRDDLELLFVTCRDAYFARPEMTGAELYALVLAACAKRGWGFGGEHAGHLVGAFPVATAERNEAKNRIRPDNHWPMNAPGLDGAPRHWILEIHLVDHTRQIGGFFEELLLPGPGSPHG